MDLYLPSDVGIGTFTPDYLLEVNGSVGKPGGGSCTNSSDIRLKQDVSAYEDGLNEILEIQHINYRYNELSGHPTSVEYIR